MEGGGGRSCFVTGATGFIGLNLVDELLRCGWVVYAMHRRGSSRASMLHELPHARASASTASPSPTLLPSLHLVEGDLGCSADELEALVPDPVTTLFHLVLLHETTVNPARLVAAPGFSPEGSNEHRRLNRSAMSAVVTLAATKGIARVVFCSSWSSYGRQPAGTRVTEATESTAGTDIDAGCCCVGPEASPVPYFQSKLECEHILENAVRAGAVKSAVIVQPCAVFGRYGEAGWCTIFQKLIDTGGNMPGLPGSCSFVDAQDLAGAFIAAATLAGTEGKVPRFVIGGTNATNLTMQAEMARLVIGGTNATNLTMQAEMARLVGVPPPKAAIPTTVLTWLARWNECLLGVPLLRDVLRIRPTVIRSPWLTCKITQDQTADSEAAIATLGYRPRPLADMLRRNHEWMISVGALSLKKR